MGLVLSTLPGVALRLPWAIIGSPFRAREILKIPEAELAVSRIPMGHPEA